MRTCVLHSINFHYWLIGLIDGFAFGHTAHRKAVDCYFNYKIRHIGAKQTREPLSLRDLKVETTHH